MTETLQEKIDSIPLFHIPKHLAGTKQLAPIEDAKYDVNKALQEFREQIKKLSSLNNDAVNDILALIGESK